jgi:uncharacterized protein (TIGR02722 family)
MKNRSSLVIVSFTIMLSLSGCATTHVEYGDASSKQALSTDFGSSDLQQIAGAMVESLLLFPPVVEVTSKRRPVISVDKVKNKTTQHVDTESITDTIRTKLLRSGKFSFVDRTTDAAAMEELKFQQNSGIVDQDKAVEMGKQSGAEYIITGNFSEITQRSGGVKDVYYKFTLNLKNLRTGLLEWSDEKEIRKVWKKPLFGM